MPADGDLNRLISAVADDRGRPIRLLPSAFPPEAPSGLWIATDRADYVAYPATASPGRRAAILAHEVAHMLLGDSPGQRELESRIDLAVVAPAIDPATAAGFLARHDYFSKEEEDAELVATRIVRMSAERQSEPSREQDTVSSRLR